MSSHKKLRLDPELPPTHRNQPGANDSGSRTFLDGSSFSSSTSGGSGAYGRSAGPFRTRYSQPLGGPSPTTNSFSRFAPYYFGKERRTSLRVPLIRARRDDSDSEGNRPSSRASLNSSLGGDSTTSATSSTAQRIIETLQNLSTPVMNAGKIRIDQDIKAVQPLHFGSGSSLSRVSPGGCLNRSTGPPKMCSSLLLSNPSPANQTSPMFNSGDQRRLFCIPRMIDAATNTDKEETPPPSQMHLSAKSVAASTAPQFSCGTNFKSATPIPSKDDNSEEEFHECSSEFTFSNPWAPDVFDRYLANQDKSSGKGAQQPLLNGFKETPASLGALQSSSSSSSFSAPSGTSPSFPSTVTTKTSTAAPAFSGFSGSTATSNFGSTTTPLKGSTSTVGKSSSLNSSSDTKRDAPNLFGIGGIGGNTSVSEINKPVSTSLAGFFSNSAASPPKTLESSKPATFDNLTGKDVKSTAALSVDKVDAPKSDSPATVKPSLGTSGSNASANLPPLSSLTKSLSKWRCPTCLVENDVKVVDCVCCGEKNTSVVAAPKPASTNVAKKQWRCPTCMVENEVEAASCVCCSEKNPNPAQVSTPLSSSVVTSKKWRCPTCMVENDPTVPSCVCCSEKNPNPTSEKKDSSNAAGTAPTPKFSFGIPNTGATSSAQASSSNSFVFGAPAQSDINKKAPVADFKFGLPSTTTNTPSVSTSLVSTAFSQSKSTAGPSTFKFGSPSPSSTTSPSPAPSFTFGGPTSSSSQVTSTVGSTSTTTSTSIFSAPKVPESNSSSTAGGPFGAPNFQTSQSTPSSSFKFGNTSSPTSNDAQKKPTPSFSFGASSSTTKSEFGSFSFGNRQQNQTGALPGATSSILTQAAQTSAPAPTLGGTPANFTFGSGNPTASPFGQLQSNPSNPTQASAGGLFQFGNGGSNQPTPSLTPAPAAASSFSLTPNLNFGATPGSTIPFGNPTQPTPNAGSQPPPSLFQFSSTPSDSSGGRRIKKAVRRCKQ